MWLEVNYDKENIYNRDYNLYFILYIGRIISYYKNRNNIDYLGVYDRFKCTRFAFGIIGDYYSSIYDEIINVL